MSEFIPRTPAIAEAYAWGQKLHAGQKRLSGEPYFETHCAWVAGFIDQLVGNEAWTIAALLHDSVEDQGETLEEIRQRFPGSMGEEVAHIIDGVTKISAPRDGRSRELETLRKIAMFRDPAVFLVKLADKSHNILTLEHMPAAKRVKKAEEAIRAYGKLAGILNCYQWRRWLEDIAFPHADPETFSYVRARIDADPRLQPAFINGMMDQLKRIMENAGLDGEIKVIVNGYWQSWQNLARMARVRRTSLNSFAAVGDVISFRMILDEPVESNCYQLLGHVNRYLGPYLDKDHFEDTIAYPENNFRALLIYGWIPDTGEIEIAITTKDYEGENQWGVVYAIQNRKDISNYRPVEILTPTGGARFLPEGSTVLDAVASIQQEILLDKISAVKVNDALARLSDKVKPGDVLEVITNGSRLQPVEEWLSFANESTRRLLRMVLATESLKRFAEKGRGDIKHLLARRGILALEDLRALEPIKMDNLLEKLASSSLEDLYFGIGGGSIRLTDLEKALDEVGIVRSELKWTTINLVGPNESNRPGVLAQLAGYISEVGGNIARSVNDTSQDGSFSLRIVVRDLAPEAHERLIQAYHFCGVDLRLIEIV